MKTIIIEDELDAQVLLANLLREFCPDVHLLGVASGVESGVELIKSTNPDLIFLDINLGNECGFRVLDQFLLKPFKVIITTAFEKYALEAFKYQAVDYLLKPYSPLQVSQAIERVSKLEEGTKAYTRLKSLISRPKPMSKISLPSNDGIHIFNVNEIIRAEADRAYCILYFDNDTKTIISKSLKEIENLLPHNFFRSHTSHLINMDKLLKYAKEDGGYALMSDGSKIPIARRRRVEFLDLIQSNA